MPIAMQATIAATPKTEDISIDVCRRYTAKPKTMATKINMMETMATEALVALAASSITPFLTVAPKVDATMAAKAATTKISVKYEKIIKRRLARRDMLAEIISPIDWPL